MTPQSNIMVVAPILENREAELRQLLDQMNSAPGMPTRKIRWFHSASFRRSISRGLSFLTIAPVKICAHTTRHRCLRQSNLPFYAIAMALLIFCGRTSLGRRARG